MEKEEEVRQNSAIDISPLPPIPKEEEESKLNNEEEEEEEDGEVKEQEGGGGVVFSISSLLSEKDPGK